MHRRSATIAVDTPNAFVALGGGAAVGTGGLLKIRVDGPVCKLAIAARERDCVARGKAADATSGRRGFEKGDFATIQNLPIRERAACTRGLLCARAIAVT